MPALPSLFRSRFWLVFLLLCMVRIPRTQAAEPTSMMAMTDQQFTDWAVGTEWSFTQGDGEERRVWFVTADACIFTRVGDQSPGGVCAFYWLPVKKGSLRFFAGKDSAKPWNFTVDPDLKTAVLTKPDQTELKATMTSRPVLGTPPDMTASGFKSWLRDIRLTYAEKQTFPEDGKIRIMDKGVELNFQMRILKPGVVYYHWKEDPYQPTLLIFNKDLKAVKCHVWLGTYSTKTEPIKAPDAAPKTADREFTDGRTTMENLKPVPLLGSASAVKALLVRELGNSKLAGSASVLSVSALPLQGDAPGTIAFNQDVGQTMRRALREVARFAALRHGGWPRAVEMQLSFADKYGGKDGPSAATACALLLDSLFTGAKLDPEFAVTGDLNADGSIQPIGGVQAKLRGATRLKCSLLGIPAKNAPNATDIALTEGLKPFMTIQVFTLATFDEALAIGRMDKSAETASAIQDFAALVKSAGGDPRGLRNPEAVAKLRTVLQRVPTHFSAQVLLLSAAGKLPKTLSPGGTLSEVDQAVGDLKTAIGSDLTANTKLNNGQITAAKSSLLKLRSLADPRVRPLLEAWAAWGDLADRLVRGGGTLSAKELKEWRTAGSRITVEEEKLRSNEAFSEDLE